MTSIVVFPAVIDFVQHFLWAFVPKKTERINILNIIHVKKTYWSGDIEYKVNGKYHREDLEPARFENHQYRSQYWWHGNKINICNKNQSNNRHSFSKIEKAIMKYKCQLKIKEF